ncbi:phytoene desaturase family protein [Salinimicrobium sediminilitoris]|uniref:phytoene desaturase family protein n=1 Tax=Salinimicrobium sediminilitoris TaxID=2876715 RepID=UPI001E417C4E|nr:phytoene desaturase family protein [Salinimicrobium sediminilitoris]MCC8359245.1 phytoene desaturase [Salinimicrobium sediminilitoris]
MSKIAVIGAGFSGLSAAAYMGAAGHEVHIFEKNSSAGGRARQFKTSSGYTYDMGPSWYWMPGVFEKFFGDFGHKVEDLYQLDLLDPSFEVVFPQNEKLSIPENYTKLRELFEETEAGSADKLDKFMEEAQYKYEQGMERLVYMPGISLTEFVDLDLIKGAMRLQVFSSFSKHVRKYFKDPKLISLMEFPVLFLGAMPQDTPALYSLMNYAGLKLGTWYPQGGFGSVIDAMVKVAREQGVEIHFDAPVEQIISAESSVKGLRVHGEEITFDAVVAAADYQHVEQKLLPKEFQNYSEKYWNNKTFAPSCLIYYLGISERIPELEHHTLFFDEDLYDHSVEIYKDPKWPAKPLFYVCCPSRTDDSVAPEGHENLFMLMPLAPGLKDEEATREKFFQIMIKRLEKQIGRSICGKIDYKKSYCVSDFITDYNSYKGNAYGLANTLQQTAVLKPKIKNKKLNNLFYAGQLTVPGPGVPPSLISGNIAAEQVIKELKKKKYEVTV